MDNTQRFLFFTENEVAVTWFFYDRHDPEADSGMVRSQGKNVSYYKRRVMRKIGVKNNNEFIIWFLKNRAVYHDGIAEFSIMRRRISASKN